jgi:hypothetical protein
MRVRLVATALVLFWNAWLASARAQPDGEMLIGSTADGGGALALAYDFSQPIVLTKQFSTGGVTLYSSTGLSFAALPADRPGDGLFVLNQGTTVRCLIRELTPVGSGLSLRFNSTTIHDPGEIATIGMAPDLQVPVDWRLAVLDDEPVLDEYRVTIRLSGNGGYGLSTDYQAIVVVDPASRPPSPTPTATQPTPTVTIAPPTATPTPTPPVTATLTPGGACTGDCDGNDRVTVGELVTAVNIALGHAELSACRAADPDADGRIRISELVRAVATALAGCAAG